MNRARASWVNAPTRFQWQDRAGQELSRWDHGVCAEVGQDPAGIQWWWRGTCPVRWSCRLTAHLGSARFWSTFVKFKKREKMFEDSLRGRLLCKILSGTHVAVCMSEKLIPHSMRVVEWSRRLRTGCSHVQQSFHFCQIYQLCVDFYIFVWKDVNLLQKRVLGDKFGRKWMRFFFFFPAEGGDFTCTPAGCQHRSECRNS